ncbi:odorant receptor 46a-like isoform X2 [Linepithema humile]|uniref:odorant receptor 46a-like isoform X2 n=1 Tax=Linepithema humile TaxID=83485 RepID=UPI00351E6ADE
MSATYFCHTYNINVKEINVFKLFFDLREQCFSILFPWYYVDQRFMVCMYGSGALVQFYILCSSVQKLLEASTEITDKAFHEDWNRFKVSVKRTFMLMMMASNNLEIKLAAFEKFSLSLPSFITVLNQAYSFALLILRVN